MNAIDRIKAICRERHIAISKLERDLGFANAYISQIKTGNMRADRLSAVADYLGVSTNYLLTGEEKQPVSEEDELWELRQALHDRPELKVMFDLTKNASPARVKKMLAMMKLMGEDEPVE